MTEASCGARSPVVHTLENLIAPGMRARLSPYVEAAQLAALLGRFPDRERREASIGAILEHGHLRITKIAQHWAEFATGRKDFAGNNYQEADFLDAYLAYYFSVNVAKVQLVLLDLVRAGEIYGALRVLDVGVGTGTTAVAVLDFLLAWSQVCDLYDQTFPVESVELVSIDKSPAALERAARVVECYRVALDPNRVQGDGSSRRQGVSKWACEARWKRVDLSAAASPDLGGYEPTLLVASNVLNELDMRGRRALETLLEGLRPGASAIVIEPGNLKWARGLMAWRRSVLRSLKDMVSLGPCGQEFRSHLPAVCDTCWHVRREAFQQTALYSAFRAACERLVSDGRSFDEFENKLLSWSYVVLGKRPAAAHEEERVAIQDPIEDLARKPVPSTVARYIGSYYERAGNPVDYDPDEFSERGRNRGEEFLKFCPARFGVEKIAFVRHPGFQMPRLYHGELVRLENVALKDYRGARCLVPTDGVDWSEVRVSPVVERPDTGFLHQYDKKARAAVDELAHRLFGFREMRDFQHQILERVLTGRSILGIAATGGGKSECFILPAILLSGITVVVSPLKSLMYDQYHQRIRTRFGLHHLTTYINGDVPFAEREARLRRMEWGCYKLVYFTPEQLELGWVLESLQRADREIGVRYLAMDEAHCISQWGHDFRPSYLNILHRLQSNGSGLQPAIIALTATASPRVRDDICDELGLDCRYLDQGGDVLVHSANRPELSLVVRVVPDTAEKAAGIVADLRRLERFNEANDYRGAALIFMPYTGGDPERVTGQSGGALSTGVSHFASYLERKLGRKVAIYHGKMDSDEADVEEAESDEVVEAPSLGDMAGRTREKQQEEFISSRRDIMVATKGFGMGVDKENIRYVIHRSPPGNLEAYAQEAGRAGRDGQLATAILYYSPDSPQDDTSGWSRLSPSDHEIQERFLRDRYIRVQDIAALWSFLQKVDRHLTVKNAANQRVAVYAYFTNDEAIEHFDSIVGRPLPGGHVFTWPDFPARERSTNAWGEHEDILDRGHLYYQKTDYLHRILAGAYRIRPQVGGQGRIAIIESYRKTGACLERPRLRDWSAIVASNAHFGRVIRSSHIAEDEFAKALEQPDLLPLAARLGVSMGELAALLSGIRNCAGRHLRGRWVGDLLDYVTLRAPQYGPAAGRKSLAQWREYAGATARASREKASRRAHRCGRREPSLDDWFGWTELPHSVGWEVELNTAFPSGLLQKYLAEFGSLLAEREQADWDAYRRLLTAYIGVNADGRVENWTKPTNCLRAVMLGYLKSHEVIAGGNCLSCNACVPESDLERYTVEQRRDVVVRMSALAEELFEQAERASAKFPNTDLIPALLAEVGAEERRGRSLGRYFEGWSARLLEDEPEHRAGILARIQAMRAGIVPVDDSELGSLAGRLRRLLTSEAAPVVWDTVADLNELAPGQVETYLVESAVRRIAGNNRGELAVIRGLLEAKQAGTISPSAKDMSPVWLRVRELCAAEGALPNSALYDEATLGLARVSEDWNVSRGCYAEVMAPDLNDENSWKKIEAELEMLEVSSGQAMAAPILGLLTAWMEQGRAGSVQERTRGVARWLEAHDGLFDVLGGSAGAAALAALLDPAALLEYQKAAGWVMRCAVLGEGATALSASAGVRLVALALAAGATVPAEITGGLMRWVGTAEPALKAFEAALLDEQLTEEQRGAVLGAILQQPDYGSWAVFLRWLELVERSGSFSSRPDVVLGFVRAASSLCAARPEGSGACLADHAKSGDLERLQTLVVASLREHEAAIDAHRELLSLLSAFPPSLAEYVEMCLLEPGVTGEIVREGFERLVASDDRRSVLALVRSARGRTAITLPEVMRRALQVFGALQDLFGAAGLAVLEQPTQTHISIIRSSLTPDASVENADLLALVIHELRKEWRPTWLTPLALEVEALVMARRYSEAQDLADAHPGLVLGSDGRPAAEWIARARTWGEPRSAPTDATVLSRVASYAVEEFKAREAVKRARSLEKSAGRLSRAGLRVAGWLSRDK